MVIKQLYSQHVLTSALQHPVSWRSQTLYQPLTATRGKKGSGNIQYNDLFSSTPKRVLNYHIPASLRYTV